MTNIVESERRPPAGAWIEIAAPATAKQPNTVALSAWRRANTIVFSDLLMAELPDGDGEGLQWHISFSKMGKRIGNPHWVRRILRDFGMSEAEEDNHEPGNARNFWLVVDPARREACHCKVVETQHVEANGHAWSQVHGEECAGCRLERLLPGQRRCPIHGEPPREPPMPESPVTYPGRTVRLQPVAHGKTLDLQRRIEDAVAMGHVTRDQVLDAVRKERGK